MNIYQCQQKAKEIGFDKAQFVAIFPAGPKLCKWLDAYFGMIQIPELGDGFVTAESLDEEFPDLLCSEPIVED